MQFYHFKSIVALNKSEFAMRAPIDSFNVSSSNDRAYIEPEFEKVAFEVERPQIILVSAVGAAGKSTLAHVLSYQTQLPLLDLGLHKPVGDNTLTGLLTNAFRVEDLSAIFEGISRGTYGVLIRGIDEGRSKTTEKAFEAFLDDLARLCSGSAGTSFVLLGRTEILEDCWVYLSEKHISTGLLTIAPFGLDVAKRYVDVFSKGHNSGHARQYSDVRDGLLERLGAAFGGATSDHQQNFLSFIGYPPVLNAIVALLTEEQNYHRLKTELHSGDLNEVEIKLLFRVVSYILRREREEKVLPNIVHQLIAQLPNHRQAEVRAEIFDVEEQCFRLVQHCLGKPVRLNKISESAINDEYEAQLEPFIQEHPFVAGRQFRSTVFEAFAVATLIASRDPDGAKHAIEYADSHKSNYHFIYLLGLVAPQGRVPVAALHLILGSALELRAANISVELHVEGSPNGELDATACDRIETHVSVVAGTTKDELKSFNFCSELAGTTCIYLGKRLSSTYASLPCELLLSSAQEVELVAPIDVSASKITLQSPALVLRPAYPASTDNHVRLEAQSVESSATAILTNDVDFQISALSLAGLTYPAIQYAQQATKLPQDASLKEKYLRLKRILVHFRSHSKGALAKYKDKIQHERVLGSGSGRAILNQLLNDGVLTEDGKFYFATGEA